VVTARLGQALAMIAGAAGLGSCTLITDSFLSNDFSGDPYPVGVDTSTGAILVGMRAPGKADSVAVLDLLSPITVHDFDASDPGPIASLVDVDVTLLGRSPSDGTLSLPRARFGDSQLITLHPCECTAADPACDPAVCQIGVPGGNVAPFTGILGADALAGDAIRLRLGDDQIFVLPDIGGTDLRRSLACDAAFDSPYRGGGTLVIDGTELQFSNLRVTLQACLSPAPTAQPQGQRGTDVLLAMSTGIGVSLLGEAAYTRYQLTHATAPYNAPALDALPTGVVYLPSGAVAGRRATIDAIALVAAASSNSLAPCRQVYAHQFLASHDCSSASQAQMDEDCPCENGDTFCPVPAILQLTPPPGIDVLVVPDTDPTLQALRTELRPDQQELDGVLGTDALRTAEIDVDYPHDRLIARCAGAGCVARPQLVDTAYRCQVNRCMDNDASDQNTLPGCGAKDIETPVTGP
jgi:hypothetical protein